MERKNTISKAYNKTAKFYDRRYQRIQLAKYDFLLRNIRLGPDDFILDVGCGTGLFMERIGHNVDRMIGIDVSKRMLRVAVERVSGGLFVLADVDSLPFRRKMFSKVFSITLLQNVPDPFSSLRELARLIRKNGFLAVTVLRKKMAVEELRKLLQRTKLEGIKVGEIPKSEDIWGIGVALSAS
ncbi:MAG: class I SAM-dependent methyltransferase [Candidatus Hodarchaeota archaeon]